MLSVICHCSYWLLKIISFLHCHRFTVAKFRPFWGNSARIIKILSRCPRSAWWFAAQENMIFVGCWSIMKLLQFNPGLSRIVSYEAHDRESGSRRGLAMSEQRYSMHFFFPKVAGFGTAQATIWTGKRARSLARNTSTYRTVFFFIFYATLTWLWSLS